MAEVIQFHCPACGTALRLPLHMAARQGPCPLCGREIVAPDPYRGAGAYPAPPAVAAPITDVFTPFAGPPPLAQPAPEPVQPESAPVAEVEAIPAAVPQAACSSQRAVLVLSILLTAAVSLVAGYLVGARSNWLVAKTPFPTLPPQQFEKTAATPPPASVPVLVRPPLPPPELKPELKPEPKPEPEKKPEPAKASAAAEAALKAFLDAPDWTTRSAYVLSPDTIRPAMEAYSHKIPDGATSCQSIAVQNSYTDKTTGNTLFIFQVVTESQPSGFPVAVAETATGWQVDWQAFIEFRDDLFKSFADGPAEQTGRFHLMVTAPAARRVANTENEYFTSFLLDPPYPGRQRLAYVRKSSETHATLSAAVSAGTLFAPVLEIAKRTTPDGKTYLEIMKVLASDWLPGHY
jgi:hypothetical protein